MEDPRQKLFDLLYERYEAPIYTYLARQIDDYDEIADLFQETFLRVWRAIPSIPEEVGKQRAYIYAIASNICIDARRKKNSQKKLLYLWQEQQYRHIIGSEEIEDNLLWQATLQTALAALPPRFAACLHLYCIDGFKQREIATILGISEKSVSSYLSRARERFRQVYRRFLEESGTPRKREATQ